MNEEDKVCIKNKNIKVEDIVKVDRWFPPRSELMKIVFDKLVLGVVLAAVLLPLQRCQQLNDIKSVYVQKVQQMNLDLLSKAQQDLAAALSETCLLLRKFSDANNEQRDQLGKKLKVKRAEAQIAIAVIDAVVRAESRIGENLSSQLDFIETLSLDSNLTDREIDNKLNDLQKGLFQLFRKVNEHVLPPKI